MVNLTFTLLPYTRIKLQHGDFETHFRGFLIAGKPATCTFMVLKSIKGRSNSTSERGPQYAASAMRRNILPPG